MTLHEALYKYNESGNGRLKAYEKQLNEQLRMAKATGSYKETDPWKEFERVLNQVK